MTERDFKGIVHFQECDYLPVESQKNATEQVCKSGSKMFQENVSSMVQASIRTFQVCFKCAFQVCFKYAFQVCFKYLIWFSYVSCVFRAHFSLFHHVKPWPPGSQLSAEAQESTVYLVTISMSSIRAMRTLNTSLRSSPRALIEAWHGPRSFWSTAAVWC